MAIVRFFLDMDTDEIAAQLGIAPATVRVHLARATAALRQELSPARIQEVGRPRPSACNTSWSVGPPAPGSPLRR